VLACLEDVESVEGAPVSPALNTKATFGSALDEIDLSLHVPGEQSEAEPTDGGAALSLAGRSASPDLIPCTVEEFERQSEELPSAQQFSEESRMLQKWRASFPALSPPPEPSDADHEQPLVCLVYCSCQGAFSDSFCSR
jgi:hypothetical protein